jgi:2-methylcitrate dehydratase PrpD
VDHISRRSFIKGTMALAAGVAAAAADVRTAFGEPPVVVPTTARSVEGGLAAFAARWQAAGPAIALTRFGRFLTNKVFNCRVAGTPRSYVLNLGAAGATLSPGLDPEANGEVVMEERDWLGVLFGDYTGLAPALAGRFHPSKDAANSLVILTIVMFILAQIPAGANPDPDLLARIITSAIARGGLPSCSGEPATLQVLDDFRRDPAGEIGSTVSPPAGSVDVTRALSEWVHGLSFRKIPSGAIESAKEQLVSILGAIYAGSVMGPGMKTARAVRAWREEGPSTVIGRNRFQTSARNAAMTNSYLAQILEWEDWTFLAHSGASIVPVALAAAEASRASGKDVLTSIVAANEILARAGEVLTDAVNTGNALVVHQIETPLVAGKLLGLSSEQLQDALGIACTQPQLTSIVSWTAEAKGMLTGWPAATAVTAAQLARAGMSGNRTILENAMGYCYRVADIASPRQLARVVEDLGKTWRFDASRNELFTKRYPTDGFQLTSVDAILKLRNGPLRHIPRAALPHAVERVEVRIPFVMAASATMFSQGKDHQQSFYDRVADPRHPDWTYIALLFDGVWPVAAALADGELTYRQYREDKLRDPVIRALTRKVVEVPDLSMGVFGATARVELRGGQAHERYVGCIDNFDVAEKMRIGASEVRSRSAIEAIVDAARHLETFDDVRSFTAML